jgi:hypothetical protein
MTYDRSDVQPERKDRGEGDGMLSGEFAERLDRGDPDARQQHLDDLIAGAVERGGIIGCSFLPAELDHEVQRLAARHPHISEADVTRVRRLAAEAGWGRFAAPRVQPR